MKSFKKEINEFHKMLLQKENGAIKFSSDLCRALGINKKELEIAVDNNLSYRIDGYVISAVCRCYNNGWENLLQAVPVDVYDNFSSLPADWFHNPKGTATILVPPPLTQAEIIAKVRMNGLDN